MDRKTFALKVLKTTRAQWDNVLAGRRNLSFKRAKLAAQVTESDIQIWMDPDKAGQRLEAWNMYAPKETKGVK